MRESSFKAFGSDFFVSVPVAFFASLIPQLEAEANRLEKKFSRFEAASELSRFNQALDQWHPVDEEWLYLLQSYLEIKAISGKALSLGTTEILEHWGYDAHYNLQSTAAPLKPKPLTLELEGWQFKSNQALDLGCLGKGYFLDQCQRLLRSENVESYVVNAGGDLVVNAAEPSVFFLEDPRVNQRVIGEIALSRVFLCASSASRRAWGAFHHLINPQTVQPAQTMQAVYVHTQESGLLTDALSTAFYVLGFEEAQVYAKKIQAQYPSLALLLISEKGKLWRTENFHAQLYAV